MAVPSSAYNSPPPSLGAALKPKKPALKPLGLARPNTASLRPIGTAPVGPQPGSLVQQVSWSEPDYRTAAPDLMRINPQPAQPAKPSLAGAVGLGRPVTEEADPELTRQMNDTIAMHNRRVSASVDADPTVQALHALNTRLSTPKSAPPPISADQAFGEGQVQARYGMSGPVGPGMLAYDAEQQGRQQALAKSQSLLDAMPSAASRGDFVRTDRYGGAPRTLPAMVPQEEAPKRPMIPMSPEKRAQAMEGIAGRRAELSERESMRQQIAAAGGLAPPRTGGVAGLVDSVLAPKRFDPSTLSDAQRPVFDKMQRIEEAKAKRARYLAGQGEYAGRGPEERAAAIKERRAPVVANAMQDKAAREWRMSGGPQQQALANFMNMRNPGLALAREGMAAQSAQSERQHTERMQQGETGLEETRSRNRRDDTQQALQLNMLRIDRRAQLKLTHPNASDSQIEEILDREIPRDSAASPAETGGTPTGAGEVPVDLQDMTTQQILDRGRARWGNGPAADAKINAELQRKTKRPSSNVTRLNGTSLWDVINSYHGDPANAAMRAAEWWKNR